MLPFLCKRVFPSLFNPALLESTLIEFLQLEVTTFALIHPNALFDLVKDGFSYNFLRVQLAIFLCVP